MAAPAEPLQPIQDLRRFLLIRVLIQDRHGLPINDNAYTARPGPLGPKSVMASPVTLYLAQPWAVENTDPCICQSLAC